MQAEFETYEIKPKSNEEQEQLSQQLWDGLEHSNLQNRQNNQLDDATLSQSPDHDLPNIELHDGTKHDDTIQAKCADESCNRDWQKEMDTLRSEISSDIRGLTPAEQNAIQKLQEEYPTKNGDFSKSVVKYLYLQGQEELANKMIRLRDMSGIMF